MKSVEIKLPGNNYSPLSYASHIRKIVDLQIFVENSLEKFVIEQSGAKRSEVLSATYFEILNSGETIFCIPTRCSYLSDSDEVVFDLVLKKEKLGQIFLAYN